MRVRFDEDARRESIIGSEPHRFPEIEASVRRCRVTRFPYSILYNIAEEEILILAAKHDRRSPDYWRYRLDR
jgi:toxin ParE2